MEAIVSTIVLVFVICLLVGAFGAAVFFATSAAKKQFDPIKRTGHYRLPWNVRAFNRGQIPDKFTREYIAGEFRKGKKAQ